MKVRKLMAWLLLVIASFACALPANAAPVSQLAVAEKMNPNQVANCSRIKFQMGEMVSLNGSGNPLGGYYSYKEHNNATELSNALTAINNTYSSQESLQSKKVGDTVTFGDNYCSYTLYASHWFKESGIPGEDMMKFSDGTTCRFAPSEGYADLFCIPTNPS